MDPAARESEGFIERRGRSAAAPERSVRRTGARVGEGASLPSAWSIAGISLGLVFYATTASFSGCSSRLPLPHSRSQLLEPFRIANRYGSVRGDDARALRNRISRIARREDLDRLSLPLQAAGRAPGAGNLRAVPAALRMEPVVCVAWDRGANTASCSGPKSGSCRTSRMSSHCSRRNPFAGSPPQQVRSVDLSILVHRREDEARAGNVVAAASSWANTLRRSSASRTERLRFSMMYRSRSRLRHRLAEWISAAGLGRHCFAPRPKFR